MASRQRLIDFPELCRAMYGDIRPGDRQGTITCIICPPPGDVHFCIAGVVEKTTTEDSVFSIITVDLNKNVKIIAQFPEFNHITYHASKIHIDLMSDRRTILVAGIGTDL